jgi:hypothetical protein
MKAIDRDGYSLTALAKVLGRAKSGLHKLAAKGQIPKQENGRFNLAAVQAALKANLEPSRAKRAPGVHQVVSEQPASEQVNKKLVKTPEEAAEAVSLIRGILESEGAAAGVIDFQAARTAELILKTRERALKMEVDSGRLCDVDAVYDGVFRLSRAQRDTLQNWPSQVGAMIASELGSDIVTTIIVLEKYIRQHLVDFVEHYRDEDINLRLTKDGKR